MIISAYHLILSLTYYFKILLLLVFIINYYCYFRRKIYKYEIHFLFYFRHLLPVWDVPGNQVVLLESKILRELDWCESDRFKLLTGTFESVKSISITEDDLILWYTKRIRSIESCTKLVLHTLEMATIARENNIKVNNELFYFMNKHFFFLYIYVLTNTFF